MEPKKYCKKCEQDVAEYNWFFKKDICDNCLMNISKDYTVRYDENRNEQHI